MIFELGNWTFGDSGNDIAVAVIEGFTQQPVFIWHDKLFEANRDQPINVGTEIVFSGYPNGVVADDSSLPSMILRRGVLASHLSMNISVPGALGRDYSLIDAFSQSGFSGAPVFALIYRNVDLHQTLVDFGKTLCDRRVSFFGSDHVFLQSAPVLKFIGINCGHFKTTSDINSGVHAGLSYFARSSVVVEALTRCADLIRLDQFVTVGTANSPIRNTLATP